MDQYKQQHVHYHQHSWKQKALYGIIGGLLATYLISGGCAPMMDNIKNTGTKLEQRATELWEAITK